MKRVDPAKAILLSLGAYGLIACSPEVGSEKWCATMQEQPKTQWSFDDGLAYTKHCFTDQSTVGSEAWCRHLSTRPKGEWTGEEAKGYARYCVMRMPESGDQY